MEADDIHERIREAGEERRNKRVAVLIAALAALLAISETGGKSAQTAGIDANIEASDTWAFYQAKTIRMTVQRLAADTLETIVDERLEPSRAAKISARVAAFRDEANRYESDEASQDGRKQLAEKAKAAEARRDRHMAAYHNFEYGSAALQLAIVLASASVITGVAFLVWAAGGLGLAGAALCALGWFAPTLLHGLH